MTTPVPRRRSVWSANSSIETKLTGDSRQDDRKISYTPARARQEEQPFWKKPKSIGMAICFLALLTIIGIIVGIVITVVRVRDTKSISKDIWQPTKGTTFQVELQYALNDTSLDVSVYNIDLYSNSPTTIASLHSLGRKVICHFSAGTFESELPDHTLFHTSDYGSQLEERPGTYWLDTRSPNVRALMRARLDLAASKGCDGVDPDKTDSYEHHTGFPLSQDTAVDYVRELAAEAHSRNLSIGLKNSVGLVNRTMDLMQWQMNENCEQFNSCAQFRPFIASGKPVFHIVYPASIPTAAMKSRYCNTPDTQGFSTILKTLLLDNWVEKC